MNEEYEQFISKCEQEGISLFRGSIIAESRPHIHIDNSNDFVKYCIQNGIKSILIEPIIVDQVEVGLVMYVAMVLCFTMGAGICYAAGDPISTVNNLSNFIFSLIRAIGLILLGLGIM